MTIQPTPDLSDPAMPAQTTTPELYRDWKGWSPEQFGQHDSVSAAYFALELGELLGVGVKRVLELGFGNGQLLRWLRDRQFEVVGVERDDELVKRANEAGYGAFGELKTALDRFGRGSMDAIVTFDVLEHVPPVALVQTLQQCADLLRPGGRFIARFPNGDSPYGRVFQHADLTHLNVIGRYMIDQAAASCDLKVVVYRGANLAPVHIGLRHRAKRTLARLVQWWVSLPLRWLYFEGVGIPMEPNVLCVLEKPVKQEQP